MVGQNSNSQTSKTCITSQHCHTNVVYSIAPCAVPCQSSTGNTMCVPAGGLQVSDGKCGSVSVFPTVAGQVPMTMLRADGSLYLDFSVLTAGGVSIPQIQSDYAQTDNTKLDFIKNKPLPVLPFTCEDVKTCLSITPTTNGKMLLTNGVISYVPDVVSPTTVVNSLNATNQLITTVNGVSALPLSLPVQTFTETIFVATDSSSIDFTTSGTSGHNLTGVVKLSTTANNALTQDATGLFVSPATSGATAHTMSSAVNTMTSVVNAVSATAPIVNTVSSSITAGSLTVSVNGVSSTPVAIPAFVETNLVATDSSTIDFTTSGATGHNLTGIVKISTNSNNYLTVDSLGLFVPIPAINSNSNTLTNPVNTLTSTVNGQVATAPAVNTVVNSLNGTNQLISTVNGVASAPLTLPSGASTPTGSLSTTTTGLTLNTVSSLPNLLPVNTTINYNLVDGIGALSAGASGIAGTDKYIGTDGLSHTLPAAPTTAFITGNVVSTINGASSTQVSITGGTDAVFGGGVTIDIKNMVGASATVIGKSGLVPTPAIGDNTKVLYGDGTWKTPSVSEFYRELSVEPNFFTVPNSTANNRIVNFDIVNFALATVRRVRFTTDSVVAVATTYNLLKNGSTVATGTIPVGSSAVISASSSFTVGDGDNLAIQYVSGNTNVLTEVYLSGTIA